MNTTPIDLREAYNALAILIGVGFACSYILTSIVLNEIKAIKEKLEKKDGDEK